MRYEVRWGNGYWRVFDTERYTTHSLCGLKKEAVVAVAMLNKRG
jgi:hypothetical protein